MKTILGVKGLALAEYAISANAVLGIRDSGKTYTATKAAEELYDAGVPWLAFDPIGVWHSLRIPGRGKGYPVVVAGGRHGDLPLTVDNVGTIVREAMKSNVSIVLDLFSVELSKADWKRIVRKTVEILLHENADYGQRHVFIEEAAEFVPQRLNGADGQVFAAVEKLVRMGGNSKLGCTLINQRSADLNKSVLELCANVFVHRQTGKNTLMDLRKWFDEMGLDKDQRIEIQESIPNLASGQCWLLSTDLKKPVPLSIQGKNSQHPDRRAASILTAAPVRAKGSDAFIAEMKAKLVEKAKPAGRQPPRDLSTRPIALEIKADHLAAAEARGFAEGWAAGHRRGFADGYATCVSGITVSKTTWLPMEYPGAPPPEGQQAPQQRPRATYRAAAAEAPTRAAPAAQREPRLFSKPQAKILESLAWWAEIGISEPTRVQVALKARMKARGGHFKTRLSELATGGLVSYPDADRVTLTPQGAKTAPAPDMNAGVMEAVEAVLSEPQLRIFRAIRQGNTGRAEIAGAANMDAGGGHFKTRLSELSSMGVIYYPSKDSAALNDWVRN